MTAVARLLIITLFLLLPSGLVSAEMAAATLQRDLDLIRTEELTPAQALRLLLAAGFVQGAAEMGDRVLFCLPAGFATARLLEVADEFLHATPERRDEPAIVLVREAFAEAFPCVTRTAPSAP